jgi:hypothetical protein
MSMSVIGTRIALYTYSEYVVIRYQNKKGREKERKKEPTIPVSEQQKTVYA